MRRSGVGCIEAEASGNSLDATLDLNRSSLLLSNGTLYFAEGTLEPPGGKELTTYHGWVLAYDPTNLQQIWSWTTTVGGQQGGRAADDGGYIYGATGNRT